MDMRVLRYFAVLADELHFGRAAARLHISQPPLSQQIRLLEEQLGTALFVRSQHRVELTEAGKTLKEQVPLIVAQFDRAIDLTRCAGRGEKGRVAVGIISSAMVAPIPRALRVFAERHPHVQWSLHEMTPAAQIDALKEKRLDVCFFRLFQDDPAIRSEVVVRETAVAALPLDHRLASREAIALGELANERFVSFWLRHSQLARFLQQCCVDARFTPRIEHEVVEVHTLLSLVREGLGVALLPASARQISTGGVSFVPLLAPELEVSLQARYRADDTSAVLGAFLDTVREVAAEYRA
ncbi:LysR substrate-binding domain-containing protein [Burkholderia multivorans]|uniref:LysR substrate-binding domain-containing protein n=1 Tax=Burkholderia multivorans TaxID=87883 RepID=UPI000CFF8218|nr:LysR substrate-binding domain-containing protein [Burkholderia multivorans]MDN8002175.1 LysR substrate-binding domain-containing protein [Burkholderia multivorans]PRG97764.1 LysR family transcriptional regulator [Burkholderia multivorans]